MEVAKQKRPVRNTEGRSRARDYSVATIKKLFGLSGNRCAFPGCRQLLISGSNYDNIANVCHIEAANPEGHRFNPNSNDDYRRSFENLILLCSNHHVITNDISVYTVSVLKDMKRSHQDLVRRMSEGQSIISSNPSALNTIIGILGSRIIGSADTFDSLNAPNPEEKILHNNVIRYRDIIHEYKVYQGKLNKIYGEIERDGSTRKEFVLRNIRTSYLEEKGKYNGIIEIRINADNIIENVMHRLWDIVHLSSNNDTELPFEVVQFNLYLILVDAFMRCSILEAPSVQ